MFLHHAVQCQQELIQVIGCPDFRKTKKAICLWIQNLCHMRAPSMGGVGTGQTKGHPGLRSHTSSKYGFQEPQRVPELIPFCCLDSRESRRYLETIATSP